MRNHKTLKDVVNDNELFSKKQFKKTFKRPHSALRANFESRFEANLRKL
jgi:hypothetical protein